jgi:hypothetical protein
MPIEVEDLNDLNPDDISTREDFLIQIINEAVPDLDLTKGGILEQLMAYPNAILDVLNQEELERVRKSTSLLLVSENPELADDALLDALLSNLLVTRLPGSVANGTITLVIGALTSVVIPVSTTFTVNGRTFNPVTEVVAVTSQDLVTNTSNVLIQGDGQGGYWFPVEVEESVVGGDAILAGTEFEVSPIPVSFQQAYAALDFNAGTAAASNTEAYATLEEGISAKAMADRVSIASLLKDQFSDIIDLNSIGYGDPEMVRDSHNIFGINSGGKADVYLRTSQSPGMATYIVLTQPTAAATGGNNGPRYNAEFIIPPTIYPALYRVEGVEWYPSLGLALRGLPADIITSLFNVSFTEVGDRGIYVPAGEENMPALFTSTEARYTRYQGNVRMQISDPLNQKDYINSFRDRLAAALPIRAYTGVGQGFSLVSDGLSIDSGQYVISTEEALDDILADGARFYASYISYLPSISEIQDFLNEYDRQAPTSADYLARAVIPCIVAVEATVAYKKGLTPPPATDFQTAVAAAINSSALNSTELPAAAIIKAIEEVIGADGYAVTPIAMTGAILSPSGTTTTITSSDALVIPEDNTQSVSNRTTAFITYSQYVSISFREVE